MARGMGRLIEINLGSTGATSGWVSCPAALRPNPGQYLLATPSAGTLLPTPLFPAGWRNGELRLAAPLPPAWTAGMELKLRGPLGRGFSLPTSARRVVLSAPGTPPEALLPLADQALQQGAAVALVTADIPDRLPAAIEVLPVEELRETVKWADYLALDLPLRAVPEVRRRLGLAAGEHVPCTAQALVRVPMPCGAVAECGACAVRTSAGWRLGCKDGPVFDFNALEGD